MKIMHADITFFTQTNSVNNLLQYDRHFTELHSLDQIFIPVKFSFKPVSVYDTFFCKKKMEKKKKTNSPGFIYGFLERQWVIW
jgi:hypothetical protein